MNSSQEKPISQTKQETKYVLIESYSDSHYGHFPPNKVKQVTTINAHKTFVQCMLILKDGRLATGSRDETIKIWNLNYRNKLDLILKGHTNSVSQIIQLKNSQVVSVDFGSLLVWNIQMHSYTLVCKIPFHLNEIQNSVAEVTKERLVTVSEYHIVLWEKNLSSYSIKETKDIGYQSILTLKNSDVFVAGSYDFVDFWNGNSFNLETRLTDIMCFGTNSLFQFNDDTLLVGGETSIYTINIGNKSKYQIIKVLTNYNMQYVYTFAKISDCAVMFGSDEGAIYEYNMEKDSITFLNDDNSHERQVDTMLRLTNRIFITGSYDGKVKIWRI